MSHPRSVGSNGMRDFSLPSSTYNTYTDAFSFLRRIMRGAVIQKSTASNDAAENNGDGLRDPDFTELAFMHQHHIALKRCQNGEAGRKGRGSVSATTTE